jgi:hypothetical protein
MAVILQMTYSKKLGLPQFSSHSCSLSLTVEIPDVNSVAQESSKLYELLQSAVDHDIQQVGFMPDPSTYGFHPQASSNGNGNGTHHRNGSNGNGHSAPKPLDRWNCTDGQRGFILRIVNENNIPKDETEDLANQLFGLGVKELNKMQASQLIEELLARAGKPARQTRWRQQPTHQAA